MTKESAEAESIIALALSCPVWIATTTWYIMNSVVFASDVRVINAGTAGGAAGG